MNESEERIRFLEDLIARYRLAFYRHAAEGTAEAHLALMKAQGELCNEGRAICTERPDAETGG